MFFTRDVMPLIDALGCNAAKCHGTSQSSLTLSLFGASPRDDYDALTRMSAGRRVNRVEPAESLLLLKTTGAVAHGGGKNVELGSDRYTTLLMWIAGGALWGGDELPALVSIDASPDVQVLEKGAKLQLRVVAVSSDGARQDVSRMAQYRSADPAVASIDAGGTATAVGCGETAISIGYMRKFDSVRIVVPQALPTPFPEVPAHNEIDELVFANLKRLGIPPAELCSDPEFLRRAYLDVIGTLPSPEDVRGFLSDGDPGKRARLVDRLLASEEFADYWALKWGDLLRMKSEYPSNLWPNAVQAYHRWVRDSIADGKPYDQFARELLTSSGSNFRNPEANYYRAFLKRTPQDLGEVTALVFMGARIGCARCHGHPTESWSREDNVGLAAFFAQVRYKRTREWKEEIVYINPRQTMRHPVTAAVVRPKLPGGDVLELGPEEDRRETFAEWLTAPDNPWFARNIVNRIWFWLLGRGIIHEPDDLRSTNVPENPDLLRYLENELVEHSYELKHVYRLILNSRTYQASARTNEFNRDDVAHFSHYHVKRLGAETLLDAIGQVTERWDTFRSFVPEPFVVMPQAYRATHLADGSIDLPFLQLFGRPPRDTAFESDRDLSVSMRQTLHLLNSSDVQNKINGSPRLRRLLQDVKDDSRIIEELYLSALSRFPTDEDRKRISYFMSGSGKTVPPAILAEQEAAREALAGAKAAAAKAHAAYEAATRSVKEAESAAAAAARAAQQAAGVEKSAEALAATKREEADGAKRRAESIETSIGDVASSRPGGADKQVVEAAAAKKSADQLLADANTALSERRQAHDNAANEAQQAEAKAKEAAEDPDATDEEKKQAQASAREKRRAAEAAKTALSRAQEAQERAQGAAAAALEVLAAAEADKGAAERALAEEKSRVGAAVEAFEAAESAARKAEDAAADARAKADGARAALSAAKSAVAEKEKLAEQAASHRDKQVQDERTASARLDATTKKVEAARVALRPRRHEAFQDLLWALLNTKEFIFNH